MPNPNTNVDCSECRQVVYSIYWCFIVLLGNSSDARALGCYIYASKQLKVHECNYLTHELELVIVVFVIKNWRHYINKVPFELYTDLQSFKYLFSREEINIS